MCVLLISVSIHESNERVSFLVYVHTYVYMYAYFFNIHRLFLHGHFINCGFISQYFFVMEVHVKRHRFKKNA